jgi:hypothetical protein
MTRHTVTAHCPDTGAITIQVQTNSATEAFATEDAMLENGYTNITID